MKKTIEDIKNEFINTIGEATDRYGLTSVAGLLKGLLFLSCEPLSLDDMAERLEVSKTSVSNNIRLLERWKAVRKVFNRGDRKNYYELRGDLWEIETEIVTTILRDELNWFVEQLSRWQKDLAEAETGEPKERAFLEKRLKEIEEYVDAMKHVLELLTRQGKVTPAIIKRIEIT